MDWTAPLLCSFGRRDPVVYTSTFMTRSTFLPRGWLDVSRSSLAQLLRLADQLPSLLPSPSDHVLRLLGGDARCVETSRHFPPSVSQIPPLGVFLVISAPIIEGKYPRYILSLTFHGFSSTFICPLNTLSSFRMLCLKP